LPGTITISPSTDVTTGTELIALYNGSEWISYQWKNGANNVGTDSYTYTPLEAGSYTVTVSATGYKSKTSAAVIVTGPIIPQWTAVDVGTIFDDEYDGETYQVDINAIAYGNGKFVAGGDYGKMATSTDGITWTAVNTGTIFEGIIYDGSTRQGRIDAIVYGNGIFVAKSAYSNKMAYSSDGVTWTAVTDSTINNIDTITFIETAGQGKFVANVNYDDIVTSTDGETWTAVSNSTFGINGTIRAIAYGNGKFVAVGVENNDLKMATSTN